MAENEGTKREKWGSDILDDLDVRLDGGRKSGSKREVALYRPGCGLLPKSPRSELEDNMSSSTSNLNAAPPSISKKVLDLPPEGAQNGPQNGSHNGPHGQSRGGGTGGGGGGSSSGGGGGRRSGHSNKGRSARSERGETRENRDSKDLPVTRLTDRFSQVQVKDGNSQSNSNEPLRSETISTSKPSLNNENVKKTRKPEQQLYVPKPIIAQSMASKEAAVKNTNNKDERWSDDDSASYCAEDDAKAGSSQGNREIRGKRRKSKKKKGRRGGDGGEGPKPDDGHPPEGGRQGMGRFQDSRLDSSNRSGDQVHDGRLADQNTWNTGPSKSEPSRPSNRSSADARSDGQPRASNRSGHDSRSDAPKSSGGRGPQHDRSSNWSSHESKGDSSRSRPPPPLMSKSLMDNRRPNHGDGDRRRFDDGGMSQSWHADASQDGGRSVRLGSEPRGMPDNSRSRDTRSVEPASWNPDKVQAKPPSGRRGSGKDMPSGKSQSKGYSNADVPPRFRKLKMQENGMKEPPVPSPSSSGSPSVPPSGNKYIGTTSEEVWDGTTVTFQGSQGSGSGPAFNMQFQSLPSMPMAPTPLFGHSPQSLPMYQPYEQWSNTLPAGRPRGRGRLRPEEVEMERAAAAARYSQPHLGDAQSASSSVENLSQGHQRGPAPPSQQRSQDWGSYKPPPSSSTPSLSGPSSLGANASGSRNQSLPSPGPLRRRPSGNGVQEERSPGPSTGRRTPTSPTSPDGYKSTSPVPRRRADSPDVVSAPFVPEITDWNEEVERSEASCNPAPPSACLPVTCQDWSEEMERVEQQDTVEVESVLRTDRFAVPHQDWSEEVERSERLEAGGGSGSHTRSPSPVSRTEDSSMWKKPVPTAQWKRNKRSGSGERPSNANHFGRGGGRDGGRESVREGGRDGGTDHPPSRSGSREHSQERSSWRRDRSGERGPWRDPAHWRRGNSQERNRDNREPSPDAPSWRSARDFGSEAGGKSGRGRRNGGRDSSLNRRDQSPYHDPGPGPDRGGKRRDSSAERGGRMRRDHSHDRDRGGRNRRNSTREHSGERRLRRNSGRDHSHERDRGGRNRRNSGRDLSRDRPDHSREVGPGPVPVGGVGVGGGIGGGGGGGTRRERMGLEWRRQNTEGIDDDWRRPLPNRQSPPPQKTSAPGILVLPQEPPSSSHLAQSSSPNNNSSQRQLFDPNNPNKPIIVVNPSVRATSNPGNTNGTADDNRPPSQQAVPAQQQKFEAAMGFAPPQLQPTASMVANQFGNTRPTWYDPYSDSFRMSTQPHLIHDIEKADLELQWMMHSGSLLSNWSRVEYIRKFLQDALVTLLLNDIKFLHKENADQHLWKILFYNIIEVLRKCVADAGPNRDQHRHLLICVIDDGINYLESLVNKLQDKYKVRLDEFSSNRPPKSGQDTVCAVIVAQKLYLFLGDLARYREQANDSANFGKARQWYIKAHQLNPKSGRPYNQLAIIAVYARRKLDAVYYYMRGLMASNSVVHTARESLLSLFDENRKKYEQTEKRRREEREAKERARMLEKEGSNRNVTSLRREVWHHPSGGQRVSRTTTNNPRHLADVSDTEGELAKLTSVDLNKRFVMSYLHIHGKLFTKVGMETFQEAALQMLREFHALLQHSPIPLNANRFLQLLALNMFAIDNTQLKELEAGYRSAAQEAALLVSLQMFSVLLERCVALLRDQVARSACPDQLVDMDVVLLLPAIKVWCDWLTCHQNVWNPPPCSADYHVGPPGDAWTRLATLVNLLDTLDVERGKLSEKLLDGYVQVRLPEDATLAGFLPLMSNVQEPLYAPRELDTELVHVCARIKRLLFFGHTFLCGIDPPVLKLHKDETGRSEYISVVARAKARSHRRPGTGSPQDSLSDDDQDLDLGMDLEEDPQTEVLPELTPAADATDAEIRALLLRKEELERHRRRQERHRKRVQDIIRQSAVEVEIEVRPHFIVPDTNCFVDHLPQLMALVAGQVFQIMVPIVVAGELEGLSRGGAKPTAGEIVDPASAAHSQHVAKNAKEALAFVRQRPPSLRCVTTRGTVLSSAAFTIEEDGQQDALNDDKILTTCLNLSRTSSKDEAKPGEPRRLVRDVVLLTEDRNLRVKALARDVPVRALPDFMRWANVG